MHMFMVCSACNHWLQNPEVRTTGPSIYCFLGNTQQIAEIYICDTESLGNIDSTILRNVRIPTAASAAVGNQRIVHTSWHWGSTESLYNFYDMIGGFQPS